MRDVSKLFQDNVSDIVSEGGVQRLYDGYFIVQVLPPHLVVPAVIFLLFKMVLLGLSSFSSRVFLGLAVITLQSLNLVLAMILAEY